MDCHFFRAKRGISPCSLLGGLPDASKIPRFARNDSPWVPGAASGMSDCHENRPTQHQWIPAFAGMTHWLSFPRKRESRLFSRTVVSPKDHGIFAQVTAPDFFTPSSAWGLGVKCRNQTKDFLIAIAVCGSRVERRIGARCLAFLAPIARLYRLRVSPIFGCYGHVLPHMQVTGNTTLRTVTSTIGTLFPTTCRLVFWCLCACVVTLSAET